MTAPARHPPARRPHPHRTGRGVSTPRPVFVRRRPCLERRAPLREPRTSFGGSFSPWRGVVSWVPRRICGACPSRPVRWCQAERDWTTATAMRLDTTGPVCFPPGAGAARDPGHSATTSSTATQPRDPAPHGTETKPNRRGPQHSAPTRGHPLAVEPAGGPAFEFRHPPNAARSRPHDVCTVTRTHARSCPATPPPASATRLAPPNCATSEAIKPCAKP